MRSSHISPDVLHPPHLMRRDRAMPIKYCLTRVQYGDMRDKGQDHARHAHGSAVDLSSAPASVINVSGAQQVRVLNPVTHVT
jgi:hypothetical protein